MARLTRKSPDAARHREPCLASSFWPRDCRHARQFRQDGRAADASATSGLVDGRIHESRLEYQTAPQIDHDFRGLPDGIGIHQSREPGEGSAEFISVAISYAAV